MPAFLGFSFVFINFPVRKSEHPCFCWGLLGLLPGPLLPPFRRIGTWLSTERDVSPFACRSMYCCSLTLSLSPAFGPVLWLTCLGPACGPDSCGLRSLSIVSPSSVAPCVAPLGRSIYRSGPADPKLTNFLAGVEPFDEGQAVYLMKGGALLTPPSQLHFSSVVSGGASKRCRAALVGMTLDRISDSATQKSRPQQQLEKRLFGVEDPRSTAKGPLGETTDRALVTCNFLMCQQRVARFYTGTRSKMCSSVDLLAPKLGPFSGHQSRAVTSSER